MKFIGWPLAFILGLAVGIGAMMATVSRYQIITVNSIYAVIKVDKWTGQTWITRGHGGWQPMASPVTVTNVINRYSGLFDDVPYATNPAATTNLRFKVPD